MFLKINYSGRIVNYEIVDCQYEMKSKHVTYLPSLVWIPSLIDHTSKWEILIMWLKCFLFLFNSLSLWLFTNSKIDVKKIFPIHKADFKNQQYALMNINYLNNINIIKVICMGIWPKYTIVIIIYKIPWLYA